MTSPEDITVSLEWAKKLKEVGWPQNNFLKQETPDYQPLFAWYSVKPDHDKDMYLEFCEGESNYGYRMYSAPTAEEILRRLPVFISRIRGGNYELEIIKYNEDEYGVGYKKMTGRKNNMTNTPFLQPSLANAAAALFVFLAEQKLLPA